jgi:maleate cis-trans isomerase
VVGRSISEKIYGYRARVGLLLPSLNVTAEPEFNKMAPKGVSIHVARLLFRAGTVEELERMNTRIEEAAELLATAHVDIIAYACTTGSLIKGLGWDKEIIRRIEEKVGIPAITTSTAVINALEKLGVKRIAVATPYTDELNRKEKEFFEACGYDVVRIEGLGFVDGEELHKQPVETTYTLARKVDTPDAQCVFISCTDFKSISVIARLESELKKPVFSSNTATMWAVLTKLNLRDKIRGYGTLLEIRN